MPTASAPSTSRRLLALLSLLQSRRDWPAPALAVRLAVSERTVRRDIDRLRELDYAIEATRGPDGGYRLEAGAQLPPLLFDDEQVVALALALRTAASLGAGVEEAAERALGTVSRLMPDRLAQRIAGLTRAVEARPVDGGADPGVLLRIGDAIRAGEELRFDSATPYADPGPEPRPVRVVEPHHLILHRGRWYLIGYSPAREDWRIHRVDRIALRSHTGRRFAARTVPGGDPARFLAARFKGSDAAEAWPCQGAATLDAAPADIAPYLDEGSIEPLDDGRCRVQLGAWSWDGLAATLSRFAVDLHDVEPAPLRAAFGELARRAAAAGAG